jgi:FlaA1/EpsC-like NDP-sugar epimerase
MKNSNDIIKRLINEGHLSKNDLKYFNNDIFSVNKSDKLFTKKIKKVILVTGGAGFIGSNFIHYMMEKYSDYRIVNLDSLTYAGNLDNLIEVEEKYGKSAGEEKQRYYFIKGDIRDANIVDKINGKSRRGSAFCR